MRNLLLILLLLTLTGCSAQLRFYEETDFFFIGTGIDPRNAVIGGTVNPPALDIVFELGYRNYNFQAAAFYEKFEYLEYTSYGMTGSYVISPGKRIVPLAGLEISLINRPWKLTPALAAHLQLELHLGRFFFYLKLQGKLRTDNNNEVIPSVYSGAAYKFKL